MNFLKKLFGRGQSAPNYHAVERQKILDENIEEIGLLMGLALQDLLKYREARLWTLTVSGFEHDERELFEIPEVRKWCEVVEEKWSGFLVHFLDGDSLRWYFACLFEIDIVGKQDGRVRFQHKAKEQIDEYALKAFVMLVSHCLRKGIPEDKAGEISRAALGRLSTAVGRDLSDVLTKKP